MVEDIFSRLTSQYRKGTFDEKSIFYFSIENTKKSVVFERDSCTVIDGKCSEDCNCVCIIGRDLFLKIWQDGYKPGLKDFMTGAIKSNAPQLLQKFLAAF